MSAQATLTKEEIEACMAAMQQLPQFAGILKAFTRCKRPVSHEIPPLNSSESILFGEFTKQAAGPAAAAAVADKPELVESVDRFLEQALLVMNFYLYQINHTNEVRDDAIARYLRGIEQQWNCQNVQIRSSWASTSSALPATNTAKRPSEDSSAFASLAKKGKPETEPLNLIRKRRENFPPAAIRVLNEWFIDHVQKPYPTEMEKEQLAIDAGIKAKQVGFWFINARKRQWFSLLESIFGTEKAKEIYAPPQKNSYPDGHSGAPRSKRAMISAIASAHQKGASGSSEQPPPQV